MRPIQLIFDNYNKEKLSHSWWISERSHPHNIDQLLLNSGFQSGPSYKGMHADLNELDLAIRYEPKFRVEMVHDIQVLDLWIKPIQESFSFSEETSCAFLNCFKYLFFKNNKMCHYLAFFHDQLAGSATLFLDEGAAGLYNGAVFPSFRNQGIMTYLGKFLLQEAKVQGYKDVVVQVSDASYGMSKKNGFKQYLNYQAFLSPKILLDSN